MWSASPLGELLGEVAAPTPAPGGGSSAAWTCALAAALVQMTARFTLQRADAAQHHERMGEVAGRAEELRAEALALAERERHAYAPVLEALRLPRDEPERAARLQAALSEAAESPLAIARAAAAVAELAAEAVRDGTRHLRGDALTGLLLAEAAAQAALRLVTINLAGHGEDPRLAEADELGCRAAELRTRALAAGAPPDG